MRRLILPLLFGVIGTAILIALGNWQLQRLAWKEAVIAEIESRITAAPGPVPANPVPEEDRYLPVVVSGRTTGEEIHILSSRKMVGPGYRIIAAFVTNDGRRMMIDRGFIPEPRRNDPRPPQEMTVTGNLHWPEEADSYTPEPDPVRDIWFARDVPAMAAVLQTEPVLVVARQTSEAEPQVEAMGIEGAAIPNDHLNYAITWFSLAAVWAGMTGFFLWRITRKED